MVLMAGLFGQKLGVKRSFCSKCDPQTFKTRQETLFLSDFYIIFQQNI